MPRTVVKTSHRGELQADRMLDMGFEPQIRKIMLQIPRWPRGLVNINGNNQWLGDMVGNTVGFPGMVKHMWEDDLAFKN